MAENSEWSIKGASISIDHAWQEYGAAPDYIAMGIQCGKLEFREGKANGQPSTKILRSQLEKYISEDPRGAIHITRLKFQTELININKNITFIKKLLEEFQNKKIELEKWLAANPMPQQRPINTI